MRCRGLRVVVRVAARAALAAAFVISIVVSELPASARPTRPIPLAVAVPVERPAARVLADYVEALATLRRPSALSFEYALSQLGLHDMEQTHRVYRRGLDERDETLVVDGYALKAPSVRILRNRTYRYDVTTTAPRPTQYTFAFVGATRESGSLAYRFATRPKSPRAFEVVAVEIDGRSSLPSLIAFRIAGGRARGTGTLRYGIADGHWVIRDANVSVTLANGHDAREKIAWSTYRFFEALPASTFEAPRPNPSASPNPLAPPQEPKPALPPA